MRSSRVFVPIAIAALAFCCVGVVTSAHAADDYRIVGSIRGPDTMWDYVSVDATHHWLYYGRFGGVAKLDLATGQLTATLVPSTMVHGVAPIGRTGLAAASNGRANTLTLFQGATGAVEATIPVGKGPDSVVYEPHTDSVLTFDGMSNDATVVDLRSRKAVATIPLDGRPEFSAAGGNGLVYDNIFTRNEIAVIDVAARRIVRHIPLPGCKMPTGLAYDARTGTLISACVNGRALFLHAADGKLINTFAIGEVPDAVILDARRRLVFIPSAGRNFMGKAEEHEKGGPGFPPGPPAVPGATLSIFDIDGGRIQLLQRLVTQPGVRTGAVDPNTGKVYLPSGRFVPPPKGQMFPTVAPGSFRLLVVSQAMSAEKAPKTGS